MGVLLAIPSVWLSRPELMHEWQWSVLAAEAFVCLLFLWGWLHAEADAEAARSEDSERWKGVAEVEAIRAENESALRRVESWVSEILAEEEHCRRAAPALQSADTRVVKYFEREGKPCVIIGAGESAGVARGLVFRLLQTTQHTTAGERTALPLGLAYVTYVQEKQCQAELVEHDPTDNTWQDARGRLLARDAEAVDIRQVTARLAWPHERYAHGAALEPVGEAN